MRVNDSVDSRYLDIGHILRGRVKADMMANHTRNLLQAVTVEEL